MSIMASLKTATLYQNEKRTVTLIDIPSSISLAQVLSPSGTDQVLLSCLPIQEPYLSTEPKSEAARAKVVSRLGSLENAYDYSTLIGNGLQEIRDAHQSDWCLPRQITPLVLRAGRKRKIQTVDAQNDGFISVQEPQLSPQELAAKLDQASISPCSLLIRAKGHLVHIQNPTLSAVRIGISSSDTIFHIPPKAGAIFTNISPGTWWAFKEEVLRLYPAPSPTAGPGQFDFILLDPPWQNRSVTRSAKYKTMRDDNPLDVLRKELGEHIAPAGLVACWITNKSSVRTAALDCFKAWNVKLIEEWVWTKTTVRGVPVYVINGLWRKPYEVLLLGRSSNNEDVSRSTNTGKTEHIARRIIAAVPDLHSRKPCLRHLVETMMTDPKDYRAVEIFARNMTAGWLACGDEAARFNWSEHWASML